MPFSPRGIEQSLVLPPRWPLILYTGTLYSPDSIKHDHHKAVNKFGVSIHCTTACMA